MHQVTDKSFAESHSRAYNTQSTVKIVCSRTRCRERVVDLKGTFLGLHAIELMMCGRLYLGGPDNSMRVFDVDETYVIFVRRLRPRCNHEKWRINVHV